MELHCLKQCYRTLVALYLIGLMLVLTAALTLFSPLSAISVLHSCILSLLSPTIFIVIIPFVSYNGVMIKY